MKKGRPQAKDITDAVALRAVLALAQRRRETEIAWMGRDEVWVFIWELAADLGQPEKLVRAKMAALIRRGLAEGCTCGCRGDFVVTQAGLDLLHG